MPVWLKLQIPKMPIEKNNNRGAKDGTGAVSRNRFSFRFVFQKIYLGIPSALRPRLPRRDVLAFNLSITLKMPGDGATVIARSHHRQATHFRYVNDL